MYWKKEIIISFCIITISALNLYMPMIRLYVILLDFLIPFLCDPDLQCSLARFAAYALLSRGRNERFRWLFFYPYLCCHKCTKYSIFFSITVIHRSLLLFFVFLCVFKLFDTYRTSKFVPVPEFVDPVFAKTSPKRSFSLIEYERLGLVFTKTGSTNSGTAVYKVVIEANGGGVRERGPSA